jgi:hypothetical protein
MARHSYCFSGSDGANNVKLKSVDHENEVNIWSMSRSSIQTLVFMEMEKIDLITKA